ncbi:MAG: CAP domain-containing protein [Rhizobiaceae bacterium]
MKAMGIAAVIALPGCQSVLDIGPIAAEAETGETYLATIRSRHGLPSLSSDARLERAAREQAELMARSGRMDHRTGRGRDFASRMNDNGIEGAAAENLAHGAMPPAKVFQMWMDSDGHRRNMLDPRFSRFGLASAREAGSDRKYWALVLGR